MKKVISILLILVLCFSWSASCSERKAVEKDQYYLGAMRVVRCKHYVSLRSVPDKDKDYSDVLAKVPLGAIVYYCTENEKLFDTSYHRKQRHMFVRCEYEGKVGYILKKYLEPAPEYEPAETKADSDIMTQEEIFGDNGSIVLDWQMYNVSVLAAYDVSQDENEKRWENIRVGCFINDVPNWGYSESVQETGDGMNLKAFMGGTEDDPLVCVYDAQYGLTVLDLMEGTELWTLMKGDCSLGDAAVVTVAEDTGTIYVTGSDGPDPMAVSVDGAVLWKSEIADPDVFGPKEILLKDRYIEVVYESGHTVQLAYMDGTVLGINLI